MHESSKSNHRGSYAKTVCSDRLLAAAVEWWKSKRPLSYSEEQHCDNPMVNTSGNADSTLALYVGQYVAAKNKADNAGAA